MFVIQQGGPRWDWEHTPVGKACWISACVGGGCTVVTVALQWLIIRKRVAEDMKLEEQQAAARAAAEAAFARADPEAQAAGDMQLEGEGALQCSPCCMRHLHAETVAAHHPLCHPTHCPTQLQARMMT